MFLCLPHNHVLSCNKPHALLLLHLRTRMRAGLGVTRVVVGRELSVREIAKVAASTDTEVEAFCHGALCVSYSGQCFSSGAWGQVAARLRCAAVAPS